jgi:DNA-binding protein YbaB
MKDFLESIAQRNDELAEVTHSLDGVDPASEFVGADASGAVTVVLTGAGHVREVSLDPGWRRRVELAELGSAVQEAIYEAGHARLEAWGESVAQRSDEPRRGNAAGSTSPFDMSRRLSAAAAQTGADNSRTVEALGEILSMLEAVDKDLDRFSAELGQSSRAFTAHSSERRVSATVDDSGAIVGVSYDERWLAAAPEQAIGTQTLQAVRAAQQLAAEQGIQARLAASPLGAMQRLATDPEHLIRRLGL